MGPNPRYLKSGRICIDLFRLERIATHVDVAHKAPDREFLHEDGSCIQEIRTSNRYYGTWTTRRIPYTIVL